jgi:hypothetical protein
MAKDQNQIKIIKAAFNSSLKNSVNGLIQTSLLIKIFKMMEDKVLTSKVDLSELKFNKK